MLAGIRDTEGVVHDIAPSGPSPVTLAYGGIDGLVGKPEPVASTAGFIPGRLVHGVTTPPIDGSLRLLVDADPGYRKVANWFSYRKTSTIIIGHWELDCRLAGPVPPPEAAPDGEPLVEMTIPLTGDAGVWHGPTKTDATIANDGDVPIYAVITWTGTAAITWPSGLTTTLPKVAKESTLNTAPETGLVVYTQNAINPDASKLVQPFTEPVAPGETARFGLSNCSLSWRVGRWSPWA